MVSRVWIIIVGMIIGIFVFMIREKRREQRRKEQKKNRYEQWKKEQTDEDNYTLLFLNVVAYIAKEEPIKRQLSSLKNRVIDLESIEIMISYGAFYGTEAEWIEHNKNIYQKISNKIFTHNDLTNAQLFNGFDEIVLIDRKNKIVIKFSQKQGHELMILDLQQTVPIGHTIRDGKELVLEKRYENDRYFLESWFLDAKSIERELKEIKTDIFPDFKTMYESTSR